MSQPVAAGEHLAALPGTRWLLWRQAVLRTTGFPASGLDWFAAQDCAAAADRMLASQATSGATGPGGGVLADGVAAAAFDEAFEVAVATGARGVRTIAADRQFREAVTWQSRSVLHALDALLAAGPAAQRTRKHRERERIIARYWQRYCAKAETIGFFGPVCWVGIDPDAPAVTVKVGRTLLRERYVFMEDWALVAYADAVAGQPGARDLLAPMLQPHLFVRDGWLLDPARPAVRLSRAEAALIARCDGRTAAAVIAEQSAADPASGLRTAVDACLLLDRLASQGVLRWNLDLPVRLTCEQVLRRRLAALEDDQLRASALAGLGQLCAARDEVAAAAGDPGPLAAALGRLDATFVKVTGQSARRLPGQMYAGRGLCWEEAVRDLDVTIGAPVLARVARPMAVLLEACRWVSATMAEAYLRALRELYDELASEAGTPDVPLGSLWFLAQGLFYGTAPRPADEVAAQFAQRWAALFGMESGAAGARQVLVEIEQAEARARRLFTAPGPGWSSARVHSPDLQLCASSPEDIASGDFTIVLGEMHVAWATNTCGVFVACHPEPEGLRAALSADLGSGRLVPLLPVGWPRYTARLAFALEDTSDAQLGFAPAPGADPDRLVPISSVSVSLADGDLVATAADGRRWPLAEVFDRPLAEVCVEAFKRTTGAAHVPRLVLGDLIAGRETWRTTTGKCPMATAIGDRERYLAARAWRHELALPDRVFLKIGTETKPVFVDLTSPLFVSSAATMIRAARLSRGDDVKLTVTEMLPEVSQAWVPDAAGNRYVSELRLQFTDPLPVRTPRGDPRRAAGQGSEGQE